MQESRLRSVPLTRGQALELLETHISRDSLRKHCLATEAVMRRLAWHFGEDEDAWGIVGLLHDLDLESIGDDASRHALVTCDWLAERGFPVEALQAIKAHNGDVLGIEPVNRLDYALTAAESVTGLIAAAALVHPSRSISAVQVSSLRKRMKERRFAANVSRERVRMHEYLDLGFDDFAGLALEAMQGCAATLGQ
jgi:predicted hydrolase (HD superfamily)